MWQWPPAYVRCSLTATLVPLTNILTPRPNQKVGPSNSSCDMDARTGTLLEARALVTYRVHPASRRIVCWIFQPGNDLLTCGVDRDSNRASYTLSILPNSNVDAAVVESFESSVVALQRHAAIAARLRELG